VNHSVVIVDGHRQAALKEVPVRPEVARMLAGQSLGARAWIGQGFTILASIDLTPHGDLRHVSISHKHRYPTWEEIKSVRAAFFDPDTDVMMMLPKAQDYVNVHPNCFHLWETPEGWDLQ
jgi:hypothetical protein